MQIAPVVEATQLFEAVDQLEESAGRLGPHDAQPPIAAVEALGPLRAFQLHQALELELQEQRQRIFAAIRIAILSLIVRPTGQLELDFG